MVYLVLSLLSLWAAGPVPWVNGCEVPVREPDQCLIRGAGDRVSKASTTVEAKPAGIVKIAELAQTGVAEAVLINKVRTADVIFRMTAEQMAYLRQNGVSDAVIAEMLATAFRYDNPPQPAAPEPTAPLPPPLLP